jgi:hypothetical protein
MLPAVVTELTLTSRLFLFQRQVEDPVPDRLVDLQPRVTSCYTFIVFDSLRRQNYTGRAQDPAHLTLITRATSFSPLSCSLSTKACKAASSIAFSSSQSSLAGSPTGSNPAVGPSIAAAPPAGVALPGVALVDAAAEASAAL